jgi:hypothetical protein
MLDKLLAVQAEVGFALILPEEIERIRSIWMADAVEDVERAA